MLGAGPSRIDEGRLRLGDGLSARPQLIDRGSPLLAGAPEVCPGREPAHVRDEAGHGHRRRAFRAELDLVFRRLQRAQHMAARRARQVVQHLWRRALQPLLQRNDALRLARPARLPAGELSGHR